MKKSTWKTESKMTTLQSSEHKYEVEHKLVTGTKSNNSSRSQARQNQARITALISMIWTLTFGFGEPYKERVCVIDDTDDAGDEDDEDVANNDLGSDGESARHYCLSIILKKSLLSSPVALQNKRDRTKMKLVGWCALQLRIQIL